MPTIASHSPLSISGTVRDKVSFQAPQIGNGLSGIEWSRDRWRHVTLKCQGHNPNTFYGPILRTQLDMLFSSNR